jgi:tRNA/rRNA methyltransferase
MMKARRQGRKTAGEGPKPRALSTRSRRREAVSRRPPAIILVGAQLPENIGFAARAMANFGLSELRLVAPREGWPNEKARAAAAGADRIIDGAKLYPDIAAAVSDLHYLLAATARPRGMVKPVLSPEAAAHELKRRVKKSEACGILFGPERSGLDNEVLSLADVLVTAPVDPSFASLSLPQAVLLFAYEWLKAQGPAGSLGRAKRRDGRPSQGLAASRTRSATRAELFALFDHLESELDQSGFLYPPEKRPAMVRAIRNMFHRMGATEQDIRTWRGIVASLAGRAKRSRAREP